MRWIRHVCTHSDALPLHSARLLVAVTHGVGDDFAGSAILGEPHPMLVLVVVDERRKPVEFENVTPGGFRQRSPQGSQLRVF